MPSVTFFTNEASLFDIYFVGIGRNENYLCSNCSHPTQDGLYLTVSSCDFLGRKIFDYLFLCTTFGPG